MKINVIKCAGGQLLPATDAEAERMTRFKTGETFEIDIKNARNPAFHRKVFSFMNFCFEHWQGVNEHQCEGKQFDVFRESLTVLAGYHESYYVIDGSVRVVAQSISYAAMEQEEFERFYSAIISAAMKNVFKTDDQNVFNRLMSFF